MLETLEMGMTVRLLVKGEWFCGKVIGVPETLRGDLVLIDMVDSRLMVRGEDVGCVVAWGGE